MVHFFPDASFFKKVSFLTFYQAIKHAVGLMNQSNGNICCRFISAFQKLFTYLH